MKRKRDLEYLNSFPSLSRLIQRFPLNRYMRFGFNNLKVLEYQNQVQRT